MFLHCRAAAKDMLEILKKNQDILERKGVVHSFDGTLDEAKAFIDLGYAIGINGWYVNHCHYNCQHPLIIQ